MIPMTGARLEVAAALARGVRVIPVLVEGAVMPVREELPESVAGLARRNAIRVRHESYRDDAGRLVTAIEHVLAQAVRALSGIAMPSQRNSLQRPGTVFGHLHNWHGTL